MSFLSLQLPSPPHLPAHAPPPPPNYFPSPSLVDPLLPPSLNARRPSLMFHPILPAPPKHASGQHQYGTRTRSNSAIKPSIRLRHSPDAPQSQRRIKPAPVRKARADSVEGPAPAPPPPDLPAFPPQHVYLHPEDAANKVFIALGRALMSVVRRQTLSVERVYAYVRSFRTTAQSR